MTNKETVEAFKKCITQDVCRNSCDTCYFDKYKSKCMDELCKRVLSVINDLQVENAKLRHAIKLLREGENK